MGDLKSELAAKVLPMADKWQQEDEGKVTRAPGTAPAAPVSKIAAVYEYIKANHGCEIEHVAKTFYAGNRDTARLMVAKLISREYIAKPGASHKLYPTSKPADFKPPLPHIEAALTKAHARRSEVAAAAREEKAEKDAKAARKAANKAKKEAKVAKTMAGTQQALQQVREPPAPAPVATAAPAVILDVPSARKLVESLNVTAAKAVYDELKKIFG
jgi:hypothetical protein